MALTGNHIRAALAAVGAVGGQMTSLDNLAAGANDALRRAPAGLTPAGAAAFLATMAQESAYFRTTTEYSAGRNRYSPFDGRTFEMLTWESNYRGFGQWCKSKGRVTDSECFVKNPRALADYKWAWEGGVWFFDHNGLWKYANSGNFLAVSQGVNGGNGTIGSNWKPSGWNARNAMYQSFLRLGAALLPGGNTPSSGHADTGQDLNAWLSDADVAKTQRILGVTPDKLAGPDTVNALEVKAGVKPDGWLDPKGSLTIKKVQARFIQQLGVHLAIDGVIGKDTAAAWHAYLVSGKFTNLAHQALNVTPFPYPTGTAYAVNDGTDHTKSGVAAKDRAAIKRIQTRLRALGHPIAVDGRYGPATRSAVITEQRKHHISADGQVGFNTWAALGL